MSEPTILFVWVAMSYVGGVTTYIRQCLDHLPAHGMRAVAMDLHDPGLPYRGQLSDRTNEIVTLDPRWYESEWRYHRRIAAEIEKIRPDVIVLNEWMYADTVIEVVPETLPIINIAHVDRPDATYYEKARDLFPRVDLVACVSERIRGRLNEALDETWHARVVQMPLGIELPDTTVARDDAGPLRLVYFGRLSQEQKRVRDFVPLVEALKARKVDFQLSIYGEGEDEAWLREAFADESNVQMPGLIPPEDMKAKLNEQDVMILLSDYEGMPLALLEAMARGVVPVVTRIDSGIDEIVEDGVNACLFECRQPEEAAERIQELAEDRAKRKTLGEAAIESAKAFDIEKKLPTYIEAYRDLIREVEWTSADRSTSVSFKERIWRNLPMSVARWVVGRKANA